MTRLTTPAEAGGPAWVDTSRERQRRGTGIAWRSRRRSLGQGGGISVTSPEKGTAPGSRFVSAPATVDWVGGLGRAPRPTARQQAMSAMDTDPGCMDRQAGSAGIALTLVDAHMRRCVAHATPNPRDTQAGVLEPA
jgi:hypothetical protein